MLSVAEGTPRHSDGFKAVAATHVSAQRVDGQQARSCMVCFITENLQEHADASENISWLKAATRCWSSWIES